MTNSKTPVYPMFNHEGMPTYHDGKPNFGLTKREYFAAKIAAGLVHNVIWNDEQEHEKFAKTCVSIADKLLNQLDL